MPSLKAAILAILASLPRHTTDADEPDASRQARLDDLAGVIAAVSPDVDRAAALVELARHETHLASYVQYGQCRLGPVGQRCDPDKDGNPTSRGPWQLKRAACPALWRTEPGSPEALRAGARCASQLWFGAFWRCRRRNPHSPAAGAFSGYARGISCDWAPAIKRAARWEQTRSRLVIELGRQR